MRPRWRGDGKELYYLTSDGVLMASEIVDRDGSMQVGKTQRLFGGVDALSGYPYDVSPDGRKFIVIQNLDRNSSGASPLTLVQNWMALLKK